MGRYLERARLFQEQQAKKQQARIDELRGEGYTVNEIPLSGGSRVMYQCTPSESGQRFYIVPGVEKELDSVTTIVDGTVRNRTLEKVRSNTVAAQLEKRIGKTLSRKQLDLILGEPDRIMTEAGDIGTEVHAQIDALLRGESPEISEYYEPAIEGWLKWRALFGSWTWLASECGIYNEEVGYAGTVDALFSDPLTGDLIVCDWKTSAGIYESAMTQLGAYAYALEQDRQNYHAHGIRAMVVRLVKDYPYMKDESGHFIMEERISKKGNAYKAKVRVPGSEKQFEPKVEYAWVDVPHWSQHFLNINSVRVGNKEKFKKERIR